MNLFIVWRSNPFFRRNTIYRKFDHGCEKVVFNEARSAIVGYEGLIVPFSELEPFVIAVQPHKKVDERALRARQADRVVGIVGDVDDAEAKSLKGSYWTDRRSGEA